VTPQEFPEDAGERTRRTMTALDLLRRTERMRFRYEQASMNEQERQARLDEIDQMLADLGDMTG
jgi:hypothetical protein